MNGALQRAPRGQLMLPGHWQQAALAHGAARRVAVAPRCRAAALAAPAQWHPQQQHRPTTAAAAAIGCSSGSSSGVQRRRDISVHAADAMPLPEGAAAAAAQAKAAAAAPASGTAAAAPGGLSKLLANLRALTFGLWTFTLAIPLFLIMLAMSPIVLLTDKFRRLAQHFVNNLWAIASTTPFYGVTIKGAENLPPAGSPAVYVANHQSFMDIYSLFHLQRPFKFISKTSNFMIPIVGWSMFLTGHVMLNRVDRRSQLKCLQSCIELLGKGASVLFFPEGTRSKDKVMGGFKKGAFSVAVKAKAPVVPITLIGTGDVMPNGQEGQMYPGRVTIVVHPPIATDGADADAVCEDARVAIASALPPELVGDGAVMSSTE